MNVNLQRKSLYKNQLLLKSLEFAADKSGTFFAGTSLALSTLRPLSILATPKTDRENKKLACAKSIASAGINYTIIYGLTNILAKGLKGIETNPSAYLKESTIKNLKVSGKPLSASPKFQFLSQFFKLGLGVAMAIPKSGLTAALIPFIAGKISGNKKTAQIKNTNVTTTKPTFKGNAQLNPLSRKLGNIMDKKSMQNMAEKFENTNYAMHIPVVGDILGTGAFIHQTNKSKKIPKDRKRVLNYNAGISTGLSIATSYVVDKLLDKPTEKFIKKFSEVNKDSPKLATYIEGIKIVKPALIMGGIYYLAIPFISTFWAERIKPDKSQSKKSA